MGVRNQGHTNPCADHPSPIRRFYPLFLPNHCRLKMEKYMESSFLIIGFSGLSGRPNLHVDSDSGEMH